MSIEYAFNKMYMVNIYFFVYSLRSVLNFVDIFYHISDF